MSTPTVLKRILVRKLEEIKERQHQTPIDHLKLKVKANQIGPMAPRGFAMSRVPIASCERLENRLTGRSTTRV